MKTLRQAPVSLPRLLDLGLVSLETGWWFGGSRRKPLGGAVLHHRQRPVALHSCATDQRPADYEPLWDGPMREALVAPIIPLRAKGRETQGLLVGDLSRGAIC